MKPVPLFGAGVRSISDVVTRQRRLNCYYDARADQDKSSVVVLGTPGHSVWCTLPSAPIYGFHRLSNTLYVVAGTTLYAVNTGGGYSALATIPTVNQKVGMEDNGVQLIIVDGVAGYVFTFATGVLTKIVDANFPNGASSVAFIDQVFYVNVPNSRKFWGSALLDGLTWPALKYSFKENTSDNLLAVGNYNGALVLHGETSTEFWQDAGTSPMPMQRIQGTTSSWGLAALYSPRLVGSQYFFLGQNPNGSVQVVQLNGYVPTPVSTSDIDDILKGLPRVTDAVSLSYTVVGHMMYQLTFPSADRSLAFDTKMQMWHEAQTGTGITGRYRGELGVAFNTENFVSDSSTGTIYLLDDDALTDAGTPIKREVCTRHIHADGNTLFFDQLLLEMETGQSDPATVAIQVSRDNGRTWGPEKYADIGPVGDYGRRVLFRRLGSGTDFVVKITLADPVRFVLLSGKADLEAGID